MSIIEAAFIAGPAVIAAGVVYIADRLSHPSGRHVITGHRSHAAQRATFADPADRDDPDGDAYVADLRPAGRFPYCWDEDETDAGWWRQAAPAGRVEVLTGPGTKIAATSQLVTTVLARAEAALPGTQDDPCDTGEFAALLARGRVTPAQETARLAEKYLT